MEMIVLIIHLLVSICLIGLVLLQRSEGGALGMGGGGGSGSLMSGRGAADALAKMTSVAGGFFLVTSLSLTVLSGAAATSGGNSVFDLIQGGEPPALAPPVETPADTAPDPTESSLPQDAGETQLAALGPAPAAAATSPLPISGAPRAGPLETRSPAPTTAVPASATVTQRPVTPPAAATRSPTATVQPATAPPTTRAPVIPNTSGSVGGINLGDDGQTPPESIEIEGDGLGVVRRERAGPDQ